MEDGPPDVPVDFLSERLKELLETMRGIKTDLAILMTRLQEARGRYALEGVVGDARESFGYPESGPSSTDLTIQELDDQFEMLREADVEVYPTGANKSEQPIIVRPSRTEHTNTGLNLIDLYNRAVTDSVARERFREAHQPLRVGTVNAVERRQNPTATINPEFQETTDGDFFAFPTARAGEFAVVPRLGLTIGAVSYHAGALGEMFGNPAYDPTRSYSCYQVRKPAIFKREGDRWQLQSPGELDLGAGD